MSEKNKHIQDELQATAPLLASLSKQTKEAPAYYFEAMQQRVLKQIKADEAPAASWFDKWIETALHIFQPKYAIPTVAVVLLFFATWGLYFSENKTDNNLFAGIEQESIVAFLAEEEVSTDAITATLNDDDIATLAMLFAANTIDPNSINEYLLEDADDYSLMDLM